MRDTNRRIQQNDPVRYNFSLVEFPGIFKSKRLSRPFKIFEHLPDKQPTVILDERRLLNAKPASR